MNAIFTPLTIGQLKLPNRLVMAPMTRCRSDDHMGAPTSLVPTYYAQRAGAGLIISEGVYPAAIGKGYVRTPGIETTEQIDAWKHVTEAVHENGGRIFMQLMHCGRISHPLLLPNNAQPVAPSAIRPAGKAWTAEGQHDFIMPRELSLSDIAQTIADYGASARRALEAGFDGVELHSASGYLPEQFLSSETNKREDKYGGSIENRARFNLEVLQAMIAEVGASRVGMKISPEMNFNDISDATPKETYTHLVERANELKLAYLHVALVETQVDYCSLLKSLFSGAYLIGGGLELETAENLIKSGRADAAVFGKAFLANPDLPVRFQKGAALNQPDRATFYSEGERGYLDYRMLDNAVAA